MSKAKIADEERIKVIEDYIQGKIGFVEIINRYGIPKSTLRHWIRKYKTFGADGLLRRKRNDSYSAEIKKQAVEEFTPPFCAESIIPFQTYEKSSNPSIFIPKLQ